MAVVTGEVRELVTEDKDLLDATEHAGGRLVLRRLHNAHSALTVHSLDGAQLGEIALPELGSVTEIAARAGEPLLHLGFTSFVNPGAVLSHDLDTGATRTVFSTDLGDPPGSITTEQTWIESADGTRLPVFLVHRADVTAGTVRTLRCSTATAASASR